MSVLTDFQYRMQYTLVDSGGLIYNDNILNEALQQALDQYNYVCPHLKETVIVLPGDSHEIALDSLADLINVLDVWWPYDSTATEPASQQGARLPGLLG
jgi:hypothetical protein